MCGSLRGLLLRGSMPTQRSRVVSREFSVVGIWTWPFLSYSAKWLFSSTPFPNILMSSSEYWCGLAAGTYFADHRLDACIGVVRQGIAGIWNAVLLLIQDLVDPNGFESTSGFTYLFFFRCPCISQHEKSRGYQGGSRRSHTHIWSTNSR